VDKPLDVRVPLQSPANVNCCHSLPAPPEYAASCVADLQICAQKRSAFHRAVPQKKQQKRLTPGPSASNPELSDMGQVSSPNIQVAQKEMWKWPWTIGKIQKAVERLKREKKVETESVVEGGRACVLVRCKRTV